MGERLGSLQNFKKETAIINRRDASDVYQKPCTILDLYDSDNMPNNPHESLIRLYQLFPGRIYARIDVSGKELFVLLDATLSEYNLQYCYLENYVPYYVIKNNDVASGVLKLYNKPAEPAKLNEKIIAYDIGDIL